MTITADAARSKPGPLHAGVIIASTRENRVGPAIAQWFTTRLYSRDEFTVDLVDLADFAFPAAYPRDPTAAMTAFTDRIDRADVFVVVTPEYNHGYPAALKQAIDFGCHEWHGKAVGFVSYGADGKGTRAVEQLRLVFASLHAATVADVVAFNVLDGSLDPAGRPWDVHSADVAAERMLDQLAWWGHALHDARSARPYAA